MRSASSRAPARPAASAIVLLALAACGGAPRPTRAAPATIEGARAAVARLWQDQLAALGRADPTAQTAAFDPGGLVFGVVHTLKGSELGPAVEKSLAGMKARGARFSATAVDPVIGVSDDGRAAWLATEFTVNVEMGENRASVTQRLTEFLGEDGGRWKVLAAHFSVGLPNDEALARAAKGTAAQPGEVPDGVEPAARPLAELFDSQAKDAHRLLGNVADRPGTVVFGTAPEEKWFGAAQIRAELEKSGHAPGTVTMTRRGGMRAGLAPGGQAGWIACNVDFTLSPRGAPAVTQPYRVLAVFVREGEGPGAGWRLAQAHFSNPAASSR
jgi:SnoaL-like protein